MQDDQIFLVEISAGHTASPLSLFRTASLYVLVAQSAFEVAQVDAVARTGKQAAEMAQNLARRAARDYLLTLPGYSPGDVMKFNVSPVSRSANVMSTVLPSFTSKHFTVWFLHENDVQNEQHAHESSWHSFQE